MAAESPTAYQHQVVRACQVCGHQPLEPVLFLGYHVPVNWMRPVTDPPRDEPAFPTQLVICPACHLAQIGFMVDQRVLFPPDYPYTTGTTQILRTNFANLAEGIHRTMKLAEGELVIDIGSNDGTLLDNSMVLYGSSLSDGHEHGSKNLPLILAGHGGKTIRSGRQIRFRDPESLSKLHLAMLQRVGADVDSFADSDTPMGELDARMAF